GCRLPAAARRERQPEDSCTACHMPRRSSASVAHAAVTDHRIPRSEGSVPPAAPESGPRPGDIPLAHFHRPLVSPWTPGLQRDLALAMVEVARNRAPEPVRRVICGRALPFLETAVLTDPDDVDAAE